MAFIVPRILLKETTSMFYSIEDLVNQSKSYHSVAELMIAIEKENDTLKVW